MPLARSPAASHGLMINTGLALNFGWPTRSVQPDTPITDISDSDWRDDQSESGSEFEEDALHPDFRHFRQPSETTLSPVDQAPTPLATEFYVPAIRIHDSPPVQGPLGPHLFRASIESGKEFTFEHALQLSPLFPKKLAVQMDAIIQSPIEAPRHRLDKLGPAVKKLDDSEVRNWTSQQVASWMLTAGFEESIVQKFEEHDIDGNVLLGLEMHDLKELDIPSFGKRHQIWNGLGPLRTDGATSPAPTCFEDISRPASRATNIRDRSRSRRRARKSANDDAAMTSHGSRKRRNQRKKHVANEPVLPAESVSIVAIEQLLPKPHKCSKGEKCSRWKKQQRMLNQLDQQFGFPVSPVQGGSFFLAGNPGEIQPPAEAKAEDSARPISDAIPSVIASSDLLGPGQLPSFNLQECMLRTIQSRDPQENVKQFLNFQRLHTPPVEVEVELPPNPQNLDTETPWFPPQSHPLASLNRLSKLMIPESTCHSAVDTSACSAPADTPIPRPILHRYASLMDVSLPPVSSTPVPRDLSHSVPPNMRYWEPVKHQPGARDPASWRRASMILPTLPENVPAGTRLAVIPPIETIRSSFGENTTCAGWMRKRKTKLLRHEWPKHHYRLNGTRLLMHASARPEDKKPLDCIDVKDYFVSCSTKAGNSKLSAALKALHISSNRDGPVDEATFGFQLVPADKPKFSKSSRDIKTHHFAVQGQHDRADWMREVMLAKAMKQKSEGYKVTMNGTAL